MPLTVNGRAEPLPSPATLQALVEALKLGSQRLAIEHNGEIVPRSRWVDTALSAGDQVEIVRAIGGG